MQRVVPWKYETEIEDLRQGLYGDDENTKRRAVAKLKAYQTRGAVPQWIESTGFLVECLLNDRVDQDDGAASFSVRLSYSMALIRFVNGLLDPLQKAQYVIPLTSLAKSIDLPRSFVELRHVATHDGIPCLQVLRHMANRALDWIWNKHWTTASRSSDLLSQASAKKKEEIKQLMREWRSIRRQDPSRVVKVGDTSVNGLEYWNIVNKIANASSQSPQEFLEVLFFMNVLTYGGKGGAKKSQAMIRLFGPLLDVLNDSNKQLTDKIVLYGLEILNDTFQEASSGDGQQNDPIVVDSQLSESIIIWLKYLTKPTKENNVRVADVKHIAETCLQLTTVANCELLDHLSNHNLLTDRQKRLSEDMKSLLSVPHIAIEPNLKKRKVDEITHEVQDYCKRLQLEKDGITTSDIPTIASEESSSTNYGWTLVKDWSPRPIGVL